MSKELFVTVWLCWLVTVAHGARIFGMFVFPSYSHNVVFHRVYEELARRGHEVVVATTDPGLGASLPTLTTIDISFAYDAWRTRKDRVNLAANPTGKQMMQADFEILMEITEQAFQMPEIQDIFSNRSGKFDLAMTEWLFPGTFVIGNKLNCPLIGLSSMDLLPIHRELAGNPTHPTYSNNFLVQRIEKDLWGRLLSADFYTWLRHYFYYQLLPACDEVNRKYIGEVGSMADIAREVSMVIVTKNPLLSSSQPNTPIIREVSGLHVRPPKPLPKSLKRFCDEATNGIVYFSLGSNVKSDIISENLQQLFLQAFAELPYNVLWKFEKTNFSDLPENVLVSKWLPQQDVLAHPKMKVFITQGGLQSLEETFRRRVPVIGMPFFIDQPANIKRVVELGIGVQIDRKTLTKEIFKRAIREVAENPKYKQNMERFGMMLEDVPVQPLDQVVHWIEHAIKYKIPRTVHNQYANIPWHHFLLLDVTAVLMFSLFTALVIIAVSIFYVRRILCYCFHRKTKIQ